MRIVHSGVEAREAVHVLLLRELQSRVPAGAATLKGGVNLRLFFGSMRYSEDMDLDGQPESRRPIRDAIAGIFEDRRFHASLQKLGLRGLDPGEGVNKDTRTVFRYKFGIIGRGEVRYPTKVEVSFRPRHAADEWVGEPIGSSFVEAYLEPKVSFRVAHYDREAAVRQKLSALAGRKHVQARDVFDLHALGLRESDGPLIGHLAEQVDETELGAAIERALGIGFAEYDSQVVEFLSDTARDRLGTREAWDEIRLEVVQAVESAVREGEARP